jgi:phage shock protein PspC (stress-responsive transcriptional regulator)
MGMSVTGCFLKLSVHIFLNDVICSPFMAKQKRLYRSKTNRVLLGVCGGLGEYFNVDPTIIRLIWTILTIFSWLVPGIVAYLIAALVIPER